jgi:hypothetical protein
MAASKDTRKVAARKRATVRAQERSRRTLRTPGATSESGMALGTVVRTAAKVAARRYKKKEIGNPVTGRYDTRTKGRAKAQAQGRSASGQRVKAAIKSGSIKQPTGRPGKGYGAMGPVSSRMAKAPVKPSARSNSAKYRGRKKK